MIVITGAAGFIGSCLTNKMNNKGHKDLVVVDDFSRIEKRGNIENKAVRKKVHRDDFFKWLAIHHSGISFIFHIGARTDTAEFRSEVLDKLNLSYTKGIWNACTKYGIPLIYASSAATYGAGELGYIDDHILIPSLKPLNPYGISKNEADKWVLTQKDTPPYWAGIKFFNVFGPNEYHKGRMASVIFHAYRQIRETGKVRLFRSHHPGFEDGKQLRDFIYVKDVIDVLYFLMKKQPGNGIFNLGTGRARSFLDLAGSVFRSLKIPENIEFIDTPEDIREKYQYFTEAVMEKLRNVGYDNPFYTLEDGIEEYVNEFLIQNRYF
ncbi:MAG: ADP-glyceromanno-heptose 6-epimerase [Bacteroidales bacterium]|nr:ADP-glyceromanno-heptose 6-epimerase [Bacteroidales bacterium]